VELVRVQFQRCEYDAAMRLLPGLLRELPAAGQNRVQCLRLLSEVTAVASYTLRMAGHVGEGWVAAELGVDIAEVIAEPILIGHAKLDRVIAALDCGSVQRGVALAEDAIDGLHRCLNDPAAMQMLSTLYAMNAFSSRILGNADDSRTWSAEAVGVAGRTGESCAPELCFPFGPTRVNYWRFLAEIDAAEFGRATELVQEINMGVLRTPVAKGLLYVGLARTYTGLDGKDREAIRYLLAAERIAPQHVRSEEWVRITARTLLERSRKQAGGSALRGLCERIGVAG
jgi:hypothetical protein